MTKADTTAAPPVPDHVRKSYDETSYIFCNLEGLILALDALAYQHPTLSDKCDLSQGIYALIETIRDRMKDLEKSRRKEWVSLGGSPYGLSDEEAAAARG